MFNFYVYFFLTFVCNFGGLVGEWVKMEMGRSIAVGMYIKRGVGCIDVCMRGDVCGVHTYMYG